MVPQPLDEVEFVRLLGAPLAGERELRDAVEMVVNGERLSELLGGLPLDVFEVRGLADAWLWGGHDVTVGRCVCSSVGCIRAEAEIVRRGPIVEWSLPYVGRKFALTEQTSNGSSAEPWPMPNESLSEARPAPRSADPRSTPGVGSGQSVRVRTAVLLAASFALVWLAFIMLVWLIRPNNTSLGDAMRLLPDTLRLVRRLSADRSIPRATRWWVWVLLVYLASPIDLVPDFIPVIGYADDAIITSFVLRHVIARAGAPKLREHWPGSEEGLSTMMRVLRLRPDP